MTVNLSGRGRKLLTKLRENEALRDARACDELELAFEARDAKRKPEAVPLNRQRSANR
jgi:hypothetical protein